MKLVISGLLLLDYGNVKKKIVSWEFRSWRSG